MDMPYLFRLGERIQRGLQTRPAEFRERHVQFLLSRQLPSGGFSGRDVDFDNQPLFEDGVQADLYYTSFAIRGLVALSGLNRQTAERVAAWLSIDIGRSQSVIDILSWLSSVLAVQGTTGIDLLANAPAHWPDLLAATLERFRRADGGYAKSLAGSCGSTYHSFLVALCYELIGKPLPQATQLLDFVRQRQRDDGGFVEMEAMTRSGTNPTAAAIALLTMFDALDERCRQATAGFLELVTGDDGGFQANTRIPFSDTLSTFTAVLTCLDLGCPELLNLRRLLRFLQELELPTGGFLAAGWDRASDVEYTYYALGTYGVLATLT